jgi:hypothetical protein
MDNNEELKNAIIGLEEHIKKLNFNKWICIITGILYLIISIFMQSILILILSIILMGVAFANKTLVDDGKNTIKHGKDTLNKIGGNK